MISRTGGFPARTLAAASLLLERRQLRPCQHRLGAGDRRIGHGSLPVQHAHAALLSRLNYASLI